MQDFNIHDWLGLPFVPHGRGLNGCDCWGLVRLFYQDIFGVAVPSYDRVVDKVDNLRVVGREMTPRARGALWDEVRKPRFGDMVAFGSPSLFYHVGIYIKPGWMLHTRAGTDSTTERYTGPIWQPRLQGFFRLKALAEAGPVETDLG